jgi:hypothetical protein
MKKLFIVIVLLSVLVNGLVGQIVNVAPNPSTTQSLRTALLLDQELWLAGGGFPTFYYSGSSWAEEYTCDPDFVSGVKNQNGQSIVYAYGDDSYGDNNLFKWSNVSKKWSVVPNIPYYLQYGAVVKVVNENCIYLLSKSADSPKLWKYTGSAFVDLYTDTTTNSFEGFLYSDNIQVIFSRKNSGVLLRYDIEQDTVTELVSVSDIEGIRDVKSVNGIDFFILSKEGNLYRYNINNQVLINLIICSESETGWYSVTMEVASTNRLIFLGGAKGIKKVWISNNGDPISEVIYTPANSSWKVLSSSHYGSRMIFAGFLGDYSLMTGAHIVIDYTTGIIEETLPNINIYPNPSKDWIKIDGITELSDVQIFDVTGKLVLQQEYQVDDRIDISNLTVGMYILNIRNSEGVSSKKIIKQ